MRLKVEGFIESQSLRQWLPPPIASPPSYQDGDPVASVYSRGKTRCALLKKLNKLPEKVRLQLWLLVA